MSNFTLKDDGHTAVLVEEVINRTLYIDNWGEDEVLLTIDYGDGGGPLRQIVLNRYDIIEALGALNG